MKLTWRFLADLGERAGWTFVEAYFTAWLMIPTLAGDSPGGFDTLFTLNNLKFAVVAVAMSVAKSVGVKQINNPNSASVLPPEAQPPAPEPPERPRSEEDVPAAGLTADEQMAQLLELAKRIHPIAAPAPAAPPVQPLAAPPQRVPLGLLDPTLVGGRDPRSEGNT